MSLGLDLVHGPPISLLASPDPTIFPLLLDQWTFCFSYHPARPLSFWPPLCIPLTLLPPRSSHSRPTATATPLQSGVNHAHKKNRRPHLRLPRLCACVTFNGDCRRNISFDRFGWTGGSHWIFSVEYTSLPLWYFRKARVNVYESRAGENIKVLRSFFCWPCIHYLLSSIIVIISCKYMYLKYERLE